MASATMASILSTPCDQLLPSFLKPFFTSEIFIPHPESVPIPVYGALIPPLMYFLALFCLSANQPGPANVAFKYVLAAVSAATFIALPFQYHVPGSAIFTYQLGLIGCFGSARVLDIFFLSRPRKPQRIAIPQPGAITGDLRNPVLGQEDADKEHRNGRVYPDTDNLSWTTQNQPQTISSRLWYALDLMISMRGIGWDFASADIRHDASPWQPPSRNQLRMVVLRLLPALSVAVYTMRRLLSYLSEPQKPQELHLSPTIIDLPPLLRPLLVLVTGISLYTFFDGGYTLVSAILLPIMKGFGNITQRTVAPTPKTNLTYFPLLNPMKLTQIKSVRSFWSKAWHRLFHRAFLVFGILPFQNAALWLFPRPNAPLLSPSSHPDPARLLPKGTHDWAKVIGAFVASGFVHAVSERAALGGRLALPPNNLWLQAGASASYQAPPSLLSTAGLASRRDHVGRWSVGRIVPPFSGGGEFTFFFLNGVAVLIEGLFGAAVLRMRKQALVSQKTIATELTPPAPEESRLSPAAAVKANDSRDSSDSEADNGRAIKRAGKQQKASVKPPAPEIRPEELSRWYDSYVGLLWAIAVLLWSGEAFVEGWIKSGILAELSMVPH